MTHVTHCDMEGPKCLEDLFLRRVLTVSLCAGFLIYFGYGMWHSTEHRREQQSCGSVPEKVPSMGKEVGTEQLFHPEKTSRC